MPGRDKDEGAADDALWRRVTESVKPLQRRAEPPHRPSPPPVEEPARPRRTREADDGATVTPPPLPLPPARAPSPVSLKLAPPPELMPGTAGGLDKRTLNRLRRGLIAPEWRIDLHNMTQAEAHGALNGFLAGAHAAGKRCVLVITGKGYRSESAVGVLKSNVPHWLNDPANRARILAFTHATPADGGEGALYVLLRRRRA